MCYFYFAHYRAQSVDQLPMIVDPMETERLVESLRKFTLDEVRHKYLRQIKCKCITIPLIRSETPNIWSSTEIWRSSTCKPIKMQCSILMNMYWKQF